MRYRAEFTASCQCASTAAGYYSTISTTGLTSCDVDTGIRLTLTPGPFADTDYLQWCILSSWQRAAKRTCAGGEMLVLAIWLISAVFPHRYFWTFAMRLTSGRPHVYDWFGDIAKIYQGLMWIRASRPLWSSRHASDTHWQQKQVLTKQILIKRLATQYG